MVGVHGDESHGISKVKNHFKQTLVFGSLTSSGPANRLFYFDFLW